MMKKVKSKLGVALASLALPLSSSAGGLEALCSQHRGGVSTPQSRALLLKEVQRRLVQAARPAIDNLNEVLDCFTDSDTPGCVEFRDDLMDVLAAQISEAKIVRALSERMVVRASDVSRNGILNLIKSGNFAPHLANKLRRSNLNLTSEDQDFALTLWQSLLLEEFAREIDAGQFNLSKRSCLDFSYTSARKAQDQLTKAFAQRARDYIRINPLLAFIDDSKELNEDEVARAIVRLIQFNANFISKVRDFRTSHQDSTYTQLNLFIGDHEMGLVNFPRAAFQVIEAAPAAERGGLCASWAYLENQQARRVNTSVLVGAATTIVCGFGILGGGVLAPGLGAYPAIASCVPALIDAGVGSSRGYKDAILAYESGYAGRSINDPRNIRDEIRSLREASEMYSQGMIVMGINLLGIYPVARGLKAVHAAQVKPSLRSVATLPASDASVSVVEMNAYRLATLIELIRHKGGQLEESRKAYANVYDYQEKCQKILNQ